MARYNATCNGLHVLFSKNCNVVASRSIKLTGDAFDLQCTFVNNIDCLSKLNKENKTGKLATLLLFANPYQPMSTVLRLRREAVKAGCSVVAYQISSVFKIHHSGPHFPKIRGHFRSQLLTSPNLCRARLMYCDHSLE
jgi:hypothetical protein